MSQNIFILPENVINKIAAGEVVQRPSSALKELLENSIDAGAKEIEIEILEGGKTFLLIRDDGFGMSKDDAILSVERHATSKIKNFEDLQKLNSFGFRGEALASIASVSQFEIKTKTKNDSVGFEIKINGGNVLSKNEISSPIGTTIIVKNLFFNTPARKEFLKTTSTEFRSCYDVITQIALSHPEIKLKFTSNNELLLNLKSEDLASRIESIYGEKIISTLLPVKSENDYLKISGFISKPDFARKAKKEQYIFLNNRFILSPAIQHAVYNGYEHLVEKGSYHFFVLNIDIASDKIDVNIHPSKLNAKFSDDQIVYQTVFHSVRNALSKSNLIPNLNFSETDKVNFNSEIKSIFAQKNIFNDFGVIESSQRNEIQNVKIQNSDKKYLGSLENKFLIFQNSDGIMIVDQHVAHERILYEKFTERFSLRKPESQQLLFPITLNFNPSDFSILMDIKNELEIIGFQFKEFGKFTIMLEAIPTEIKIGKESKILQSVIDEFKLNIQKENIVITDNLAKSLSCKAAIKAGDELTFSEIEKLIDELFKSKLPYVCPHGRPVIINISVNELNKRFLRI